MDGLSEDQVMEATFFWLTPMAAVFPTSTLTPVIESSGAGDGLLPLTVPNAVIR